MIIIKEFDFDAAHYLPAYNGKCEHLHGHTYKLVVCFFNLNRSFSKVIPLFFVCFFFWALLTIFSNRAVLLHRNVLFYGIEGASYYRLHSPSFDNRKGSRYEKIKAASFQV